MTEHTQDPLFMHPEPLTHFRLKDVATAVARGGVPYPTAQARVSNYAKAGQIHVRGRVGEGRNSPNVFGITDVAAAVVLSALQDCGMADQDVLNSASSALYFWHVGQTPRSAHPILAALSDTLNGRDWVLQLRFMRHAQTEQRLILRNFGPMTESPFWAGAENATGPEWAPVGEILINTASLHQLSRLIETPTGAN